jgi:hypothetical protein
MHHQAIVKKNQFSAKALLLLGVYLMHFAFFQFLVSTSFTIHQSSLKAFFCRPHHQRSNNTTIAVFRTIEKHEVNKKAISPIAFFSVIILSAIADHVYCTIDYCHLFAHIPFSLPDSYYQLYLRGCAFRI